MMEALLRDYVEQSVEKRDYPARLVAGLVAEIRPLRPGQAESAADRKSVV